MLSSAWWVGRWEAPLDQNRKKTSIAQVTAQSILRIKLQPQLEAAVRESVPVGRITVPTLAGIGASAGFSLRSSVWQGNDEQWFYGGDFTIPCRDWTDVSPLAKLVETPQVQRDDPRIRFMIAPDKSATLATQVWGNEFVSDQHDLTACQRHQDAELAELTRAHPRAITEISAVPATAAHFGQPSYFAGDSHWTPAGAAAAALRLGTWISPASQLPPSSQLTMMRRSDRTRSGGDLYRLAGLAKTEEAPLIETVLPGSVVRETPLTDPVEIVRSQASRAPLQGRTLMYVDSYFYPARDTLTPLFGDLTVITNKADVGPYLARHAREYDHVIVSAVQRHAASTFVEHARSLVASLSPEPSVSWAQPTWPASTSR